MRFKRTFCLLAAALAPASGLLLASGCAKPIAKPAPPVALPDLHPAENRYVGSEACSDCHSKEFQAHRNSRHAQTAHLVRDVRGIVVPTATLFGSRCRIRKAGDSIRVSVGDSPLGAETMQYGLGSGKTGITFVSVTGQNALFEMRASYFPHIRAWYPTPGHKGLASDEMGLDYPVDRGRQCMGCHTTTLPVAKMAPEPRFLGVGCEACHGPGESHIAAVKRGDLAHLAMEPLGRSGAESLNTLCGRCHRTGQDVMQHSPGLETETQRFQTYGIMKSRCFKESNDTLSCLNCHDPHSDAASNMAAYERACLSCHRASPAGQPAKANGSQSRSCPVNPRAGCIACHMPARKLIPNADKSPLAVDHFIHIPPNGSRPSPYAPPDLRGG